MRQSQRCTSPRHPSLPMERGDGERHAHTTPHTPPPPPPHLGSAHWHAASALVAATRGSRRTTTPTPPPPPPLRGCHVLDGCARRGVVWHPTARTAGGGGAGSGGRPTAPALRGREREEAPPRLLPPPPPPCLFLGRAPSTRSHRCTAHTPRGSSVWARPHPGGRRRPHRVVSRHAGRREWGWGVSGGARRACHRGWTGLDGGDVQRAVDTAGGDSRPAGNDADGVF